MVETSVWFILIWLLNLQNIQSIDNINYLNGLKNEIHLNTTSGLFQGKQVTIQNVSIRQFFGISYGEKPVRFERSTLRRYNSQSIIHAIKQPPACPQISDDHSYGPFQLSNRFDEDCLTLNIFIPEPRSSSIPKAIMVFSYSSLNQIGSASLVDGSVLAALGDVIVITINHRLNIFGFLSSNMPGNYGLYDQLLALKWISLNAKQFNGDSKRITYVGHSTGAVNALLLAMSNYSDGLLTRVIAQSGCPLNRWAIDRQPKVRFNNVMKQNNMNVKKKFIKSSMDRLKTMPIEEFHYMYRDELSELPDYPFPVVDDDLIFHDFEYVIRTGSLRNIDILIGVTADESLSTAEEHIFYHYLPKNGRPTDLHSSISKNIRTSSTRRSLTVNEQAHGFSYFRKNNYIKKYLQTNHPEYLCFYDEIRTRYTPMKNHQHNVTETTRLYTDLVSDLMIYYDLIHFLHERLYSKSLASTYVYYYTNPPLYKRENSLHHNSHMVGHFAELDLLLGLPFLNRSDIERITKMNLSYTSNEIELSHQMIRYWTNFAKTGNQFLLLFHHILLFRFFCLSL
ncbi:hypothetical protein I4U23_018832 [Adineta vaga]|nr:hypothetical protein I4U23_018832 [Adineta vaga]